MSEDIETKMKDLCSEKKQQGDIYIAVPAKNGNIPEIMVRGKK